MILLSIISFTLEKFQKAKINSLGCAQAFTGICKKAGPV
jgi:hypothetical protein